MKTIKITLIALLSVFGVLGSTAMAQSVRVIINPTPDLTISGSKTVCTSANNELYEVTNLTNGPKHFRWRFLPTGSNGVTATASFVETTTDDSTKVHVNWSTVVPATGGIAKIEVSYDNDYACPHKDTIEVTVTAAPALTLLATSKTACVSNSVDLIDAFISTTGFTNYTYVDKTTLASDLTFYSDPACTTPLPAVNYIYTPTAIGTVHIYAILNNGTCSSITYDITLDVQPEPTVVITTPISTNPTVNGVMCDSTTTNLASYIQSVTGADSIEFSLSKDFSSGVIAKGIAGGTINYLVDLKNTVDVLQTIYVRAKNTAIDLPCLTSAANIDSINLTVHPKLLVSLVLNDGSYTGGTDTTGTFCQIELTDGTGTTLSLIAKIDQGGTSFATSGLKYKIDNGTEQIPTPDFGSSPLPIVVSSTADGLQHYYTITYAKDNNGCIYTHP